MAKNEKNITPICESEEVHESVVNQKREAMPSEELLYDLSDFFKILGDSTRMNILFAIDGEPMCVCDIAALLGMTKSAVSHQLKALRLSKLVKSRRDGQVIYYSLADDHVKQILDLGFAHLYE